MQGMSQEPQRKLYLITKSAHTWEILIYKIRARSCVLQQQPIQEIVAVRIPLARARFLCLPPFAHRYIVYFVSVYLSPDGLAEPATVIGNFVKCSVRHSVIVCFNIRIQDESLERQCLVRITAMQHIIQHYYGIFHLATPCNSSVAESSVQYGTGSE